jgi:hypothetical protein
LGFTPLREQRARVLSKIVTGRAWRSQGIPSGRPALFQLVQVLNERNFPSRAPIEQAQIQSLLKI